MEKREQQHNVMLTIAGEEDWKNAKGNYERK